MKRLLVIAGILIFVGAGIFAFKILPEAKKIAAFSKIRESKPALTIAEVENLMGSPTRIEHSETTGITGDVYHYPYHDRDMKIVFVNGVVFNTEVAPGAKS